jgi:hypothetical protein
MDFLVTYYKGLPLWRNAMRRAVEIETAAQSGLRDHTYTLGTELRRAGLPNVGADSAALVGADLAGIPYVGADLAALRSGRRIADRNANAVTKRGCERLIVVRGANAVATPSRRLPPNPIRSQLPSSLIVTSSLGTLT